MYNSLEFTYRELGPAFYAEQKPTPVLNPELVQFNNALANKLLPELNSLDNTALSQQFSGNVPLSQQPPIASVYGGHQFGHWNPQLGDGRAVLLGETVTSNGERYDLQLKGSGRTPYSRNGDGRSALGPVIREYLLCEAMYALNIPTTRALAAVRSGEGVYREQLLPGGIFTRVARSHIRVGTFQYFYARQDNEAVRQLANHVITRHFPTDQNNTDNPYLVLLNSVITAQAKLIAKWMAIGFIHGVMNTDNMLICGETVDYGPCAFLDAFVPGKVFSSIDEIGRYAYNRQPQIAKWNLSWFARCLLNFIEENEDSAIEKANVALNTFDQCFDDHYNTLMANKIGFMESDEEIENCVDQLLNTMATHKLDYTLSFSHLTARIGEFRVGNNALLQTPDVLEPWIVAWQAILVKKNVSADKAFKRMSKSNPWYIPRNHLVERAIAESYTGSDQFFKQLLNVVEKPFDYNDNNLLFMTPPASDEEVKQTFCGT